MLTLRRLKVLQKHHGIVNGQTAICQPVYKILLATNQRLALANMALCHFKQGFAARHSS
ncbi:hypothetical protein [Mesorhizobium sp.]|uniref:hypothetical protein n=1 Tax=Mesorhizobium sp. TaxID=1871066 RepID=UPI0025BED79B|nr:hypothetical protein [Mesorhizobium sp.]